MHTVRKKRQWSVNYQGSSQRKYHLLHCVQWSNLIKYQQGQRAWIPFRTPLREWNSWESCCFTTQEFPLSLSGSEADGLEEVFTLRQAGEIAQWLKVLVALLEHLLSVPALHQAASNHLNSSYRGFDAPLFWPQRTSVRTWCTEPHKGEHKCIRKNQKLLTFTTYRTFCDPR